MKVPINTRLLHCADLVPKGSRIYDVGCDHGYLGIYLLLQNRVFYVTASDLRPKPLERARENGTRFGCLDRMNFICCSGLDQMDGTEGDTVVIAGMGGDCIARILDACPWVKDEKYTLVLQPQSSGNDLRRYLGQSCFSIEKESLVQDGHFIYSAMVARFGHGVPLSPGQQYLSPQLLESGGPLLDGYLGHILNGLVRAVDGLRRSSIPEDALRLPYYETALREIQEMKL